jgi:hypothetical protein
MARRDRHHLLAPGRNQLAQRAGHLISQLSTPSPRLPILFRITTKPRVSRVRVLAIASAGDQLTPKVAPPAANLEHVSPRLRRPHGGPVHPQGSGAVRWWPRSWRGAWSGCRTRCPRGRPA